MSGAGGKEQLMDILKVPKHIVGKNLKSYCLTRFKNHIIYTNGLVVRWIYLWNPLEFYHITSLYCCCVCPNRDWDIHNQPAAAKPHHSITTQVKPKVEVVTYHCETCGSEIFQSVDAWLAESVSRSVLDWWRGEGRWDVATKDQGGSVLHCI